jgi:hypothetical protein
LNFELEDIGGGHCFRERKGEGKGILNFELEDIWKAIAQFREQITLFRGTEELGCEGIVLGGNP